MKRELADALAALESAGDTITYREAVDFASGILRECLDVLNPAQPEARVLGTGYACARCQRHPGHGERLHHTPHGYLCVPCLGRYVAGGWPTTNRDPR